MSRKFAPLACSPAVNASSSIRAGSVAKATPARRNISARAVEPDARIKRSDMWITLCKSWCTSRANSGTVRPETQLVPPCGHSWPAPCKTCPPWKPADFNMWTTLFSKGFVMTVRCVQKHHEHGKRFFSMDETQYLRHALCPGRLAICYVHKSDHMEGIPLVPMYYYHHKSF